MLRKQLSGLWSTREVYMFSEALTIYSKICTRIRCVGRERGDT